VFAIAVSGDGARLVSVSDQEGRVIIWDAATASPVDTLRVGQGVVTSMAFSPDSAVLGSVGYNGVIQLRLLADGRSRSLAGSVSASQALAFLNEGRLAAITDEASVVLIDVAAENTAQLSGLSSAPASVAASANGSLLASGTLSGTVTLWDGRTGEVAGELRGSLPVGALLAFSSDAGLLAVGGPPNDPRIEVWDLARREVLHTIVGAEAPIGTLAFQPGGALLAAADLNGALTLYDSASGAQIRTIQSSPENGWFAGMGFSPDGGLLATGTPTGLIQLWNPVTGAEIARLEQDFGVVSLAFSPDGTRLAVSGRDASVRLYEAP
jgi:WD40 repeat protein